VHFYNFKKGIILDTKFLLVSVSNLVDLYVVWTAGVISNYTPLLPAQINSIKSNGILNLSHNNSVLIENVSYSGNNSFEACFRLSKFICNECSITPVGNKKNLSG
jgi:hypothetical protein